MTNRIDCDNAQGSQAYIDVDMDSNTWVGPEAQWGADSGPFVPGAGAYLMSDGVGVAIAQFNAFPANVQPGNAGGGNKISATGTFETGLFRWNCAS